MAIIYNRCRHCNAVLDDADLDRMEYTECLDGENGWQRFVEYYCPICGSDDIEQDWDLDEDEDDYYEEEVQEP